MSIRFIFRALIDTLNRRPFSVFIMEKVSATEDHHLDKRPQLAPEEAHGEVDAVQTILGF